MADINGELERLEETVQYSLEHNIKRQEILDVLDEFLKGLKEEDRDILCGVIGIWMILKKFPKDILFRKAR